MVCSDAGNLNGDFTITNLNKYYLNAEMFSSWNLRELNDFIELFDSIQIDTFRITR